MITYRSLVPFATLLLACGSADNADEAVATTSSSLERDRSSRVLAGFDPSAGQLPEGLALHRGRTYVSFAPLAQIAEVAPSGTVSTYATLPPANGQGFTLGLLFDGDDLLAAQASFDPSAVKPGIYRIPAGGGEPTAPWAADASMTFPNGLTLDRSGMLWVADSTGVIFRVDRAGNVSEWTRDPLLVGDPSTCGYPLPIGANGIIVTGDTVWVTSTARGALVRIPILDDGTAGAATAVLDDCSWAGADGLVRARDGSLLFALNAKDQIVRFKDGSGTSIVDSGAPLDFPASLVIQDDRLVVSNAAFFSGASGAPSVVVLEGDERRCSR
jgi:sugar lactone lactonase YvrE